MGIAGATETAERVAAGSSFASVRRDLAVAVAGLNPAGMAPGVVEATFEDCLAMEKQLVAAKLLLAKVIDESGAWKRSGHRTPGEWLARKSGTGAGPAKDLFDAAKQIADQPVVEQALRDGKLSGPQATEIAAAAAADPSAESKLVDEAAKTDLKGLRESCRRTKHAAERDREATNARIHRNRSFKTSTESDTTFVGMFRFTSGAGAAFMSCYTPFRERAFAQARREGRREPYEAIAADALLAMALAATRNQAGPIPMGPPAAAPEPASPGPDGPPRPARIAGPSPTAGPSPGPGPSPATPADPASGAPCSLFGDAPPDGPAPPPMADVDVRTPVPATVYVIVDRAALLRGETVAGERCEIRGIGAVPVSEARRLMADAFLVGLLTDGTEVQLVKRYGRRIPVEVRDALCYRDNFTCETPGCSATHNLEIDHHQPVNQQGPTSYDNLGLKCRPHHRAKTETDRLAALAHDTERDAGPDPPHDR